MSDGAWDITKGKWERDLVTLGQDESKVRTAVENLGTMDSEGPLTNPPGKPVTPAVPPSKRATRR